MYHVVHKTFHAVQRREESDMEKLKENKKLFVLTTVLVEQNPTPEEGCS